MLIDITHLRGTAGTITLCGWTEEHEPQDIPMNRSDWQFFLEDNSGLCLPFRVDYDPSKNTFTLVEGEPAHA